MRTTIIAENQLYKAVPGAIVGEWIFLHNTRMIGYMKDGAFKTAEMFTVGEMIIIIGLMLNAQRIDIFEENVLKTKNEENGTDSNSR